MPDGMRYLPCGQAVNGKRAKDWMVFGSFSVFMLRNGCYNDIQELTGRPEYRNTGGIGESLGGVMTRQEFISTLGAKLSEEFSTAEVLSQIQYYQGYIDGEMRKGKTEEEILDELGDPMLIAKTILESPREDSSYGYVRSQQDAYDEGAYQGEYQKSAEDIKAQMWESRDATSRKYREAQERAMRHQAEREAAASRNGSQYGQYGGSQTAYEPSESQYDGAQTAYGSAAGQQYGSSQTAYGSTAGQQYDGSRSAYGESRNSGDYAGEEAGGYRAEGHAYRSMEADDEPQHVRGEVEGKRSLMRDANGDFNWGMLALIIGVVLVLIALAWIVGKILVFFGPLLLVLLVVFLIMHAVKGDK